MKNVELVDLLKLTNADGAILVSLKGELIKCENIKSSDNISAMLGVLMSMCKGFSEDMKIGKFKQLIIKSSEGVFIADEIEDLGIIGLFSKDLTKGGVMKIALDKLLNN